MLLHVSNESFNWSSSVTKFLICNEKILGIYTETETLTSSMNYIYIEFRSITFFSNFRVVGNPVKSEDPGHTIDLGDHDGIPSVGGD